MLFAIFTLLMVQVFGQTMLDCNQLHELYRHAQCCSSETTTNVCNDGGVGFVPCTKNPAAGTLCTDEQGTLKTTTIGYTEAAVSANTDVAANTAKVGYTEAAVSANTDVAANTLRLTKVPIYQSSMVPQSSTTAATDSQIDLPGLSFRWKKHSNGEGKLEVKAESNSAPQYIMFYFSYHTDSNDIINFRPFLQEELSTSTWNAVDCSACDGTPNLPSITGSYSVYEFDFSVYPLNTKGYHLGKTYNVKLFLGAWGGVHMRASYQ